MVVKMMRWSSLPYLSSRKFETKLVIHRLEGLTLAQPDADDDDDDDDDDDESNNRLVVEVKWKGQKGIVLGRLRRSVKRNVTEEGRATGDGAFEWNEEFKTVCYFSGYKKCVSYPWEVVLTVFKGLKRGPSDKLLLVGAAVLNLAEFATTAEEKALEIHVPLMAPSGNVQRRSMLCLSVELIELRAIQHLQPVQSLVEPISHSPSSVVALQPKRDEHPVLKVGLRKLTMCLGENEVLHEDESSDSRLCVRNEDAEYNYPFGRDSLDDDADRDPSESNGDSGAQLSVNYETLACSKFSRGLLDLKTMSDTGGEGWIYYNNYRLEIESSYVQHSATSVHEQTSRQSSKRGILSWTNRILSFRSKAQAKGEPLLKKDYREEGGDDIDFDRRQLSSSDESGFGWNKSEEGSTTSRTSFSEFGDDNFAVGSWEPKEVKSRDGLMKLRAQVFFASIDQRNERAAGESACTALVAVIANWLRSNQYEVPIKSEFDSLIREGSFEWRNLCENEDYRKRFPDKHFDLETVLWAKIRPLSVVAEGSFIGFFHPEGLEGGDFEFLNGAMSFDSIWEEISHNGSDLPNNFEPLVYIVSWNDHFFILKVAQDAYYIIDTLGERLYEGCNQAYVLKFDKDTTIHQVSKKVKASDENSAYDMAKTSNLKEKRSPEGTQLSSADETGKNETEDEELVCEGKESCKQYIKSFMAAIPIRELQADIKKGLMASTPLHHRLQIEFHYTKLEYPSEDKSVTDTPILLLTSALAPLDRKHSIGL